MSYVTKIVIYDEHTAATEFSGDLRMEPILVAMRLGLSKGHIPGYYGLISLFSRSSTE